MDFDLLWLLWALPLAFALGWIASRLDLRQGQREQSSAPKLYYKGLNLLLNEQQDKAIDTFIEAVQQDPDTTELHFALGNLFRRRGEYERAVRVHQHLLGRGALPQSDREQAQYALAQDYMKAGLFDRAQAAYEALAGTTFDTEARLALLDLHERAREWQAAAEVAEQLQARGPGSFASRMAHHWCELALEADAAQRGDVADAALAKARALAPDDARPLVLAGERAAAKGDDAEALQPWQLLMTTQPAAFNLVARRYAVAALRAGQADDALQRLTSLYRQAPTLDLLDAVVTLQGDGDAKRRSLLAHVEKQPSLAAAAALLDISDDAGLSPGEAEAVGIAVQRAAKPLHRYRCAACGFEAEHYFWQCPGCLGWNTFPPRRLQDL